MSIEREKLVKIFKALGNERRFLIIKHLSGKKELTVNQISELIHLSFKSVSKHLLILKNAGLVDYKASNLNKIYFLRKKDAAKEFVRFF
ncbi:MAG: hypothetical protein A3A98_03475 [Candidatus Staskawiczbacteria bacterium RIFCSPLOWO2_01_FULL_40_39]|uniref:HTH arsR-type domain-containing protein n=1 Tax=Candidatus Staskawiczbacteria bacterium RIFCSPHIGHO2_01_FULL_39_25 TaxID=1802202 RepID=A0A1G2HQB9_9BACT|nr:MAG: hypothetical protein A2730_02750 [Candidatus Staskawiczbacteria bacterium RIFCSPHIGHO2_01_FULL_39_25]OGZ72874.1 MAG: hypothetical protein A3A98_03475 [Candidatus Staskawiczbacteria bacterium RIFCSPLOWO2_01_FULL_40_39]OGZ75201.1 MAG: hypothetical protein A3I87_00810 [Candidatus Staskawiczbacteria bacterium RIFCSPLOWO2_02_FULL_39_8]